MSAPLDVVLGWPEYWGKTMNGIAVIRILGMVTGLLLVAASGAQETPLPQAILPPTGAVEVAPGTVVPRPAMLDSPEQAQKLVSFPVLRPDPDTLPAGLELAEVGW